MIEIKEDKINNINFLELDDKLYEESEFFYYKSSIYIIQWNNMKDVSVSYSAIKNIYESKLEYSCELDSNSKISIIFNLLTNKVI